MKKFVRKRVRRKRGDAADRGAFLKEARSTLVARQDKPRPDQEQQKIPEKRFGTRGCMDRLICRAERDRPEIDSFSHIADSERATDMMDLAELLARFHADGAPKREREGKAAEAVITRGINQHKLFVIHSGTGGIFAEAMHTTRYDDVRNQTDVVLTIHQWSREQPEDPKPVVIAIDVTVTGDHENLKQKIQNGEDTTQIKYYRSVQTGEEKDQRDIPRIIFPIRSRCVGQTAQAMMTEGEELSNLMTWVEKGLLHMMEVQLQRQQEQQAKRTTRGLFHVGENVQRALQVIRKIKKEKYPDDEMSRTEMDMIWNGPQQKMLTEEFYT